MMDCYGLVLFLIFHLAFIIAPAGILLAAYFDKGMNFVLIVIGSLFLVINGFVAQTYL